MRYLNQEFEYEYKTILRDDKLDGIALELVEKSGLECYFKTPTYYFDGIREHQINTFINNIFGELPKMLFERKQFVAVLNAIKTKISKEYKYRIGKLPSLKFFCEIEDEESISIKMKFERESKHGMVYFRFEDDENESRFGLIWRDTLNGDYISQSRSIVNNPLTLISDLTMQMIDKFIAESS